MSRSPNSRSNASTCGPSGAIQLVAKASRTHSNSCIPRCGEERKFLGLLDIVGNRRKGRQTEAPYSTTRSPAATRSWRTSLSPRKYPCMRRAFKSSESEAMSPARLARSNKPAAPIQRIPSDSATLRPSASSIKRRQPGDAIASATAAASPRSTCRMNFSAKTGSISRTAPARRETRSPAYARPLAPAVTSSQTARGIHSSQVNARRSPNRPILAKPMSGIASAMIRDSSGANVMFNLLFAQIEPRNAARLQCIDKLPK